MGALRQKNTELSKEIQNFKKEVEDINKDNATYMTLEKKYDTLIKEVRQLEGDLADINLA
jgi:predicted  nucleic acid-binding Zn-ribbon protein